LCFIADGGAQETVLINARDNRMMNVLFFYSGIGTNNQLSWARSL
jgi:hypothetical protein